MGSTLRPVGGYIADKLGGTITLSVLLLCIGLLYGAISLLPSVYVIGGLLLVIMGCLGMGNGAVFQLVPQYFRREIGIATGIIGAFGGLGGFYLPTMLGIVKQVAHSYAPGLISLCVLSLVALVVLRLLVAFQAGWRLTPQSIAESSVAGD
jgi:NNP family nitrate/nitrite transporter-like MFS transporter